MTEQPQDNLSRFTNRTRPQTQRGEDDVSASLRGQAPDAVEATSIPRSLFPRQPSTSELERLEAQLQSFSAVEPFMMRLDAPVKEAIQEYARRNNITPECLFQGFWQVAQTNSLLLERATTAAALERDRRKKMADLKKAITAVKKTQK